MRFLFAADPACRSCINADEQSCLFCVCFVLKRHPWRHWILVPAREEYDRTHDRHANILHERFRCVLFLLIGFFFLLAVVEAALDVFPFPREELFRPCSSRRQRASRAFDGQKIS